MLDKNQARKLAPMVKNKKEWAVLLEYLNHLKTLELQVLAVATSELEIYRSQGKLNSLVHLEQLESKVDEALNRKEN
jgi:hypothetical protein